MQVFRNASAETFHRLLGPRTAYLIGSVNADGSSHLCAASNLTNVSNEPQLLALALWPSWTTTSNILENRTFTVNLMDVNYIDSLWIVGYRYSRVFFPEGANKFAAAGLHSFACENIAADGVQEALAILECEVLRVVEDIGDHIVFFAHVIQGHCQSRYFDSDDVLDTTLAHTAMQNSGNRFAQSFTAATANTAWCSQLSEANLSDRGQTIVP